MVGYTTEIKCVLYICMNGIVNVHSAAKINWKLFTFWKCDENANRTFSNEIERKFE